MQRVELSNTTEKLRRNVMFVGALIIGIVGFNIQIGRTTPSGLELKNLTTQVIIWILVALLLYHAVAFAIRALEDFRYWELTLPSREGTFWGAGVGVIELATQLKEVSHLLEKIIDNEGEIRSKDQTVLTEQDAKKLLKAADGAERYAKRFENFPKVTALRFFLWDVGSTAIVFIVAMLFALHLLPTGLLACWLS